MGYTHYWRQKRDLTETEWAKVVRGCADIFAEARKRGIVLRDGFGTKDSAPVINHDEVIFNGDDIAGESHETMLIDRKRPPKEEWQTVRQRGFGFCKTARKPYDAAVVAVLIMLDEIGAHDISSDGEAADWEAGLALAREALIDVVPVLQIPIDVRRAA